MQIENVHKCCRKTGLKKKKHAESPVTGEAGRAMGREFFTSCRIVQR